MNFSKKITPLCFLILIFFIYYFFACRSLYFEDSSEFVTVSFALGIAHPPGYPLYVLLGRIFSLLPIENIPFKINILSGFFGTLTIFFLYLIIKSISNSEILAVSSSLLFAFTPTFWSSSEFAEVYSLNTLFVAILIYLVVKTKNPLLFSYLFGLGLCNHHSLFLILPAIFFIKNWNKKKIISSLLLFLFGLTLYLYIPIRAGCSPQLDWYGPTNVGDTIKHITREYYWAPGSRARTFFIFSQQLRYFFTTLLHEFWLFSIVGFLGIFLCFKKERYKMLLLLLFISFTLGVIVYTNFPLTKIEWDLSKVFFIPAFFIFTVFCGVGLDFWGKKLKPFFIYPVILGLVFYIFSKNLSSCSKRNYFYVEDWIKNVYKTLPENSAFFVDGDTETFSLAYSQFVDKKRQDIEIYDYYGNIFPNIYGKNFPEVDEEHQKKIRGKIIESCLAKGKLVYLNNISDITLSENYRIEQEGILHRVIPKDVHIEKRKFDYTLHGSFEVWTNEDYLTRFFIAQTLFFVSTYEENDKLLNIVKKLALDIPEFRLGIARFYISQGLKEEAMRELYEILMLDPFYKDTYIDLIELLGKERVEEAHKIRKKMQKYCPE